MMTKVSALLVKSLWISSELSSINQKVLERDHRLAVSFRHYSQSSTSNWGTGEPPVEGTPMERGVASGQSASSGVEGAEKPIGRQASEPTSSTKFDTEAASGEQKPKKSRTGGDMTDEGQVHTPNLQKMRSTRDIIHSAGKETMDRLASEKKSAE